MISIDIIQSDSSKSAQSKDNPSQTVPKYPDCDTRPSLASERKPRVNKSPQVRLDPESRQVSRRHLCRCFWEIWSTKGRRSVNKGVRSGDETVRGESKRCRVWNG